MSPRKGSRLVDLLQGWTHCPSYAKKNSRQSIVDYLRQPLEAPQKEYETVTTCLHEFVEEWNLNYFVCVDCMQALTDTARIDFEIDMKRKTRDNTPPEAAVYHAVKCRWLLQFTMENNLPCPNLSSSPRLGSPQSTSCGQMSLCRAGGDGAVGCGWQGRDVYQSLVGLLLRGLGCRGLR